MSKQDQPTHVITPEREAEIRALVNKHHDDWTSEPSETISELLGEVDRLRA